MSHRRFKVWTSWHRGRLFDTLAEAQAAADVVLRETGHILLITEEKEDAK